MAAVVRVVLTATLAAWALGAPALAGDAWPADLHSSRRACPRLTRPRSSSVPPAADSLRPVRNGFWFAADGTVENVGFAGPSPGRNAAKIDFAEVDRVVVDGGLCTTNFAAGRPFLTHAAYSRINIRCGTTWRYLTDYEISGASQDTVRAAILALGHLAANAKWEPTDDTSQLPDIRPLYHTAASTPRCRRG